MASKGSRIRVSIRAGEAPGNSTLTIDHLWASSGFSCRGSELSANKPDNVIKIIDNKKTLGLFRKIIIGFIKLL